MASYASPNDNDDAQQNLPNVDAYYGRNGNDIFSDGGNGSFTLNFDGGNGNDTLFTFGNVFTSQVAYYGGDGNDWLQQGSEYGGFQRFYGGEGEDILQSLHPSAFNFMEGGGGRDAIYGGGGTDVIYGGDGNDSGFNSFDESVVTVTAGAPYPGFFITLQAGLFGEAGQDSIYGGQGDDLLNGGSENDFLSGDEGDDRLIGGTGADVMDGGPGNDQFFVDNAADSVSEARGQGTDRVFADVSYALAPGAEIETMSTTDNAGTAPINLSGNELAQTIFGNAGDNMLRGLGGGDSFVGLGGNDFYFVDDARDNVSETAGQGTDRVFASVSWNMTPGAEIEMLTTADSAGTQSINLRGNEFANTIIGNAGANIISGGLGSDTLFGLGGNDFFLFDKTPGPGNVDQIADFAIGEDRIVFLQSAFTSLSTGALSAANFLVRGTAAQDGNDFVIYDRNAGSVFYDADGSGAGVAVQIATVTANLPLQASDFVVV
jgi:Ca2+-binding RTX toxin-like protein